MKNSPIIVRPADDRRGMDDFVRLPRRIYRHCPQWVPDLEGDVRDTFRPSRNAGLAFCEVQPFVAYRVAGASGDAGRGRGLPVGRVAGIINRRANERWQAQTVRFGFLEMEDDAEVARALLEAVERWGRERGMTRIEGPMGITDFDKEGMLVEDFHLEGSMTAIYNPPYYPRLLEALGYAKAVDWVQVRLRVPECVPAPYARAARLASEMFHLRVRVINNKEAREGYGRRIFRLLNEAYAPLFGFVAFTEAQADEFVSRYLRLVDLRLVPVVEDAEGRLVGVAVCMRSIADGLRRSRGRLWPLGWWHLLRALGWRREPRMEMLLIAVETRYRGLGVNALFFQYLIPLCHRLGIRWAETGPQLEHNQRVLGQWEALRPQVCKRRRCYCKKIER